MHGVEAAHISITYSQVMCLVKKKLVFKIITLPQDSTIHGSYTICPNTIG